MPAFEADSDHGVLASHGLTLPATYSFKCYGTPFDVVVTRNAGGGARLTLRGDLGVLPFTAESRTARHYMRAVIDVGHNLPHAEITLSKTQSIILRGAMDFENPPSSATAVAATAVIVIAGKPFVDIISIVRHAKRLGTLASTGKKTP